MGPGATYLEARFDKTVMRRRNRSVDATMMRILGESDVDDPIALPDKMATSEYHRAAAERERWSVPFFEKFPLFGPPPLQRTDWWVDAESGEPARVVSPYEQVEIGAVVDGFKVVTGQEAFDAIGKRRAGPINGFTEPETEPE